MGSWLTGILINADLKAVQIYSPSRPYIYVKSINHFKDKGIRDNTQEDRNYLTTLVSFFGIIWGESADDLGGTGRSLDFEMKGFR